MTALHVVKPDSVSVSLSAQALRLADEFSFACGLRQLPYMAEEMTKYLLSGFAPEMIREAIARTARAPRPSFAYLAAIMRNAAAAGQYDFASFAAPRKKKVSAQDYNQRSYTEEELLAVSDDLIEEARKLRDKRSDSIEKSSQ